MKQKIKELTKNGQDKFITPEQAAELIKDGDVLGTSGFMMSVVPEEIFNAIEERYLKENAPRNLTVLHAAGQGDWGTHGLNHLGHQGLLKRIIGGHYGESPRIVKLVLENKIEAYNLPQGVISQQFRQIASHKKGVITHVGLDTFVDPRIDGGKLNEKTTEDLVKVIEIEGEELLFYKALPVDVALIRGTTADRNGNITLEKEAFFLEVTSIAQAARNSGGIVIVQVERIAENKTLDPQKVKIPGIYVDAVVVADQKRHKQTMVTDYNPAFSGEIKMPVDRIAPLEMGIKKIIGRRAAMELMPDSVINLGIGIPEAVASIAAEEGLSDNMTLTIESGIVGGVPAWDYDFGAATNPQAIIDQTYQFDFYDGGGIDITFLGLAEIDSQGNVNVSKFAGNIPGCGGFINISQNTQNVIFCGAFTAGGLDIKIQGGKLIIVKEGRINKFKSNIMHKTFSGRYARQKNQKVLIVTERAVFELGSEGIVLKEIAPGIDLERDIIDKMEFKPVISKDLKEMDSRIFSEKVMNIQI